MKKRIIKVLVVLIILALLGFTYLYFYNEDKIALGCLIYENSGIDCISCRATRMVNALVHLDFKTALQQNAVLFYSLPFFAYVFTRQIYFYIKNGKSKVSTLDLLIIFTILISLFIQAILN